MSGRVQRHGIDIGVADIRGLQHGRFRQQGQRLLILLLPNLEQAESMNGLGSVGRDGDCLFQPPLTAVIAVRRAVEVGKVDHGRNVLGIEPERSLQFLFSAGRAAHLGVEQRQVHVGLGTLGRRHLAGD